MPPNHNHPLASACLKPVGLLAAEPVSRRRFPRRSCESRTIGAAWPSAPFAASSARPVGPAAADLARRQATHATLGPDGQSRPRTAVTEAVVAASDRPGFAFAHWAAPILRPVMRTAAARLWRDDLAYAERRWHLHSTGRFPG